MAYEYITKYTSPTFTPRAQVPNVYGQTRAIKSITIHHWGNRGQRFQDVVNFLCSNAPTSAHYVVEDGKVACIVDPEDAAWHSGNATGNATSIGIECRPEATSGDYATTAELIRELRAVYGNLPLVPHKDWFNTACPGVWDLGKLDKLARTGSEVKPAAVKPKPKPKPAPKPKAKSISQLADEVIAGKHGSGDARKKALGPKYNAVQAEVNRKLLGKPKGKSISQLADEVIAGKHGDGAQRQRSLGAQYAAVQAEVNRRYR